MSVRNEQHITNFDDIVDRIHVHEEIVTCTHESVEGVLNLYYTEIGKSFQTRPNCVNVTVKTDPTFQYNPRNWIAEFLFQARDGEFRNDLCQGDTEELIAMTEEELIGLTQEFARSFKIAILRVMNQYDKALELFGPDYDTVISAFDAEYPA